jgi:hypothetical protein
MFTLSHLGGNFRRWVLSIDDCSHLCFYFILQRVFALLRNDYGICHFHRQFAAVFRKESDIQVVSAIKCLYDHLNGFFFGLVTSFLVWFLSLEGQTNLVVSFLQLAKLKAQRRLLSLDIYSRVDSPSFLNL